jgi:hypothetical protein
MLIVCSWKKKCPITWSCFVQTIYGFFPHIHSLHPVCHFSWDHGRSQFLGNSYCFVTRRLLIELCAVISLSLGDLFFLKKPSYTTGAFLHSRHFTKQLTAKRKDDRSCHLLMTGKYFQSLSTIYRKPHVARSICLRHKFSKPRRDFLDIRYLLCRVVLSRTSYFFWWDASDQLLLILVTFQHKFTGDPAAKPVCPHFMCSWGERGRTGRSVEWKRLQTNRLIRERRFVFWKCSDLISVETIILT